MIFGIVPVFCLFVRSYRECCCQHTGPRATGKGYELEGTLAEIAAVQA